MKIVRVLIVCLSLVAGAFPALAVDQSFCTEGEIISLHDAGTLKSCNLRENYDINGITCKKGYDINFYTSGELRACVLYRDSTVSGVTCREDGEISFFQNGNLAACVMR